MARLQTAATVLLSVFPARRMLHDVIISVQYFQVVYILFPPEGNFDIDAGDGGGGTI